MPQPKRSFTEAPAIAGLVSDPNEVPEVRLCIGLPGRSPRKGFWRLYLTLDLTEYLEVRDEDVVHSENLDTPETPLRGTVVWLKATADVARTRGRPQQMQAEFLGGDIVQGFLAGAEMEAEAARTWTLTIIATTLLCAATATATICTTGKCLTKSSTSRTSCCLCPTG
jgi:hypothetical protein